MVVCSGRWLKWHGTCAWARWAADPYAAAAALGTVRAHWWQPPSPLCVPTCGVTVDSVAVRMDATNSSVSCAHRVSYVCTMLGWHLWGGGRGKGCNG